jgi:hypothetical protein
MALSFLQFGTNAAENAVDIVLGPARNANLKFEFDARGLAQALEKRLEAS